MGRSLRAGATEPPGSFVHQASGSKITIFYQRSTMHHRLEEQGLSADYPIAYSIGYGKVGKSYLIDLKGHLFQSPAAHYTAKSEWDASPGYEGQKILDFSRSINSGCLFCHSGTAQSVDSKTPLVPITCERCHGPSEKHLARPVPGSIVNPAKLQFRQRDSVCEQCHLEGATLVLNPGKSLWDFHPGQILEENQSDYVYRTSKGDLSSIHAVSHAEQLAVSKCRRASGEKLWCGTCHDPHGDSVNRKVQMREICQSCHPVAQLANTHKNGQDDCVSCHMPRLQASDIGHAAITDHRIARRPGAVISSGDDAVLSPWQPPLPEFAKRNLGLALFNTAKARMSGPTFEKAYVILAAVPGLGDAPVCAAKGYMLLGVGQARAAVGYFQQAVQVSSNDNEYWLDLAVAQDSAGDSNQAVASFRRSIEIDPYDYRAYKGLAALYTRLNRSADSQTIQNEYPYPRSLEYSNAPSELILRMWFLIFRYEFWNQ